MMSLFRIAVDRVLETVTGASRFHRAHERVSCAVWVKLNFIDRGFSSVGLIDEVSQGGMRFRPAQSYICVRSGDVVRVTLGPMEVDAVIVNTTEHGYGLKCKSALAPEEVQEIAALSQHESLAA